jgi:hypothetical protein
MSLWSTLLVSLGAVFLVVTLVDYFVNRQSARAIRQHLQETSEAAERLVRDTPEHEERREYIQLRHMLPWGKAREMARRITKVEAEGWTYRKASAVSPLRSIRSLGGALNLYFVRAKANGNSATEQR